MNTPVNNISEPIILPQGILIFQIRDKRKMKKFSSLEEWSMGSFNDCPIFIHEFKFCFYKS